MRLLVLDTNDDAAQIRILITQLLTFAFCLSVILCVFEIVHIRSTIRRCCQLVSVFVRAHAIIVCCLSFLILPSFAWHN